jgi:uncharacterized membrane protein SpoIIM required for sporulation
MSVPLATQPDPPARRTATARQAAQRFETLLERAEQMRVRRLSFDEVRELGTLYRLHTVELAAARERGDDPDAIRYLNALCVRAYTALFAGAPRTPARPWRAALRDALGQTWRVQLLAWALLGGGMTLGLALAWNDPAAVHALVPESMGYSTSGLDRMIASPAARSEFLAAEETPIGAKALFGSFLFSHNTRVALLAFATGMLAGVPTVLLQLYNGLVLGAFASIFLHDPWPLSFLAWILPHGIPELTAICLCTAAGLHLGAAVAAPGRQRRPAALRAAVPSALVLVGAALPLLAVAALIEGFVRESAWGTAPRLAVAAACLLATIAVLVATRRSAQAGAVDTEWLREVAGRP